MATKKKTEEVLTPEVKIAEIAKDLAVIEKQANAVVVKSEEDRTKATELMALVKGRIKRVEDLRTFFVKPLNDQVAKINAMFREKSEPLKLIEAKIKRAISDYLLEEDRKAKAEEERLRKLQEAKNARREEKGKPIDTTPVPTVERPTQTAHTASGTSTAKKVWKFEIVDESKVPVQFMSVDPTKIRQAVKDGARAIDGVRIFEDYDISGRSY